VTACGVVSDGTLMQLSTQQRGSLRRFTPAAVLWAIAAAAAIGVLVLLLLKVQAVNWRAHYETRDALRSLQILDAELDTQLLLRRRRMPQDANAIADLRSRMREIEDRLFGDIKTTGHSPAEPARLGYAGEAALVQTYYARKSAKHERIEAFLELNRAIDDAVAAMLRDLDQLDALAAAPPVRAALLRYLYDGSEDSAGAVLQRALALSASASGESRPTAAAIARNAAFVVPQTVRLDAELLDIVNAPDTGLDALSKAYTERYAAIFRTAETYRLLLIVYASLLLVGLVGVALRLRQSYATLESRVEERTQQLTQAYDELKQSQLQMMQAEKMASLGQMVAGVAHEINTPLGYSRSNVAIVRERLDLVGDVVDRLAAITSPAEVAAVVASVQRLRDEDYYSELDELLAAAGEGMDQIGELVTSLRDFSRLDRSRDDKVDLNRGIDDVLRIAGHTLKKHRAAVHRDYAPLPLVRCAPSQINQVLLNLVVNAAQALPEDGGNIGVQTRANGRFVEITVEDDGKGIPAEALSRIFDPFFTTKAVGKGTGLGLSIAYQIVRDHGGSISVESQPGAGARFVVTLPVT
jgi:two-component system NtrC family sensor kinase